jgi:hypothetical protein
LFQIQDEKLDKQGFLEFASVVTLTDAAKIKIAEEMAEECISLRDDDRCELGFKIGICLKMGGVKRKVDFGF